MATIEITKRVGAYIAHAHAAPTRSHAPVTGMRGNVPFLTSSAKRTPRMNSGSRARGNKYTRQKARSLVPSPRSPALWPAERGPDRKGHQEHDRESAPPACVQVADLSVDERED